MGFVMNAMGGSAWGVRRRREKEGHIWGLQQQNHETVGRGVAVKGVMICRGDRGEREGGGGPLLLLPTTTQYG